MYLGFADLVQLRKVSWFNSVSDSYFINIDIVIVRDKLDYIWSQNIIAAIMVIIMTMALRLHNVKVLNFVFLCVAKTSTQQTMKSEAVDMM